MSKRPPFELGEPKPATPVVWKSLEALEAPEVAEARKVQEFPDGIDVPSAALVGRRGFLTLASATAAAVGLEGCIRRPAEKILPYAAAPEQLVPGVPLHYATVTSDLGEALGLLVTTHDGRPTKVEGNPEHPSSSGATTLQAQASLLDLYDPDRSRSPLVTAGGGRTAKTFAELDAFLTEKLRALEASGGRGLRILATPTTSPSFARLREAVRRRFPQARVHAWSPVNGDNAAAGARAVFGDAVRALPDYRAATRIVSLDCDFMQTEPGSVAAIRGFADGRRLPADTAQAQMNRLYVVEPSLTTTGANADHRLRLPARDVERYARALLRELGTQGADLGEIAGALGDVATDGIPAKWLAEVARDLREAGTQALVVVGSRQPAAVHAIGHALNAALGSIGVTVRYVPVFDRGAPESTTADLMQLATDMDAGTVDTLLVLGGNPVYDAPADAKFGERLAKVQTSLHLSSRDDETSRRCTWHVPLAHELEAWGDLRASDGTWSVQQPMIAPLRGGRSELELLAFVAGEASWRGYHVVRKSLAETLPASVPFERAWRAALHAGFVDGTGRAAGMQVSVDRARVAAALRGAAREQPAAGTFELAFAPCNKMRDGRHGNNAWLLELPDPITRITWDNAAYVSPTSAEQLGVRNGDVLRISSGGASVELPAWILPGHADGSVTLTLGWGREHAGRHGDGQGTNVYPLRTSAALGFVAGARVERTGQNRALVQTQDHWDMEGRPVAIDATLPELIEDPRFPQYRSVEMSNLPPLYQRVDYSQVAAWGLAIDLTACVGCNACVVACQAENNIPVVGKDLVRRGREMHWLRIDRYFVNRPGARGEGRPVDVRDPAVSFQPVACQQCEDAPCENVCPVNATAHSPEGLNDMAYNRCIGTRYCANNCPYKARRYNYLAYHAPFDDIAEEKRMQFNPNVTVRMRGVMEKCTYCVQRIQGAKIASRNAGVDLQDGDIQTACQQACPAQAMTFGNLSDPSSRVAKLRSQDRRYLLLAEVGTFPRTFYLAKIRNTNPEMPA